MIRTKISTLAAVRYFDIYLRKILQAIQSKENSERVDKKTDPKLLVTLKKGVETLYLNININISEMHRESLREQWAHVAARLDMILMVIFLILNAIILVAVIGIGNSMLND
jgi:hypothetical protein